MDSSSVSSVTTISAFPPASVTLSAVSCNFRIERAAKTTVAASCANATLIALPIPLLAPVTIATFEANCFAILVSVAGESWADSPVASAPLVLRYLLCGSLAETFFRWFYRGCAGPGSVVVVLAALLPFFE